MNKNEEFELEKEKTRREFELEQEKLTYEFELEQKKISYEFELQKSRYSFFQKGKEHLRETDLQELLKFEGNRLEKTYSLLKEQAEKQKQSLIYLKVFLTIVLIAGLVTLSIPIISIFREIPSTLIFLSVVCAFLFGIWFYTNWEKLYYLKCKNENVRYNMEKSCFLLNYIKGLSEKEVFNG